MLTAIDDSNRVVDARLVKDRATVYRCRDCDEPLIWVNANTRVKHFRHRSESSCISEPETEEHILYKAAVYDAIEAFMPGTGELEGKVNNRRADVLWRFVNNDPITCRPTEHLYAFEAQLALYDIDEFRRKIEDYMHAGARVVYLLGGPHFYNGKHSDESGFEGDPRPRRRWDKKGHKTRSTKNGDHLRMNALGMVCPRSGEFFAIEATHVSSDMFQAFLNEADSSLTFPRNRNILILDNASWHKKKSLQWHHFEPLYLPPYTPDFIPIERLWLVMKDRWFNNVVCKNMNLLIQRLDRALLDLIGRPEEVKVTTSFGKLL